MEKNGETIYNAEICQPRRSSYASFTRAGNTLYMHVHFWPGEDVAISGLMVKAKSARLLKDGRSVTFTQDPYRLHLTGLPMKTRPTHPLPPLPSNAMLSRNRIRTSSASTNRAMVYRLVASQRLFFAPRRTVEWVELAPRASDISWLASRSTLTTSGMLT